MSGSSRPVAIRPSPGRVPVGADRGWCPAWSSKPVGVVLDAAPVGSIPMRSRHSPTPVHHGGLPRKASADPVRAFHRVPSAVPMPPAEPSDADSRSLVDARSAAREAIRRHISLSFLDGRAERLTDDTPLVTSGIIDSAGVLHLVDWLEGHFGLRIDDEEVVPENFDSLDALARLVSGSRD